MTAPPLPILFVGVAGPVAATRMSGKHLVGSIYTLWGASGERNWKQFDEKWCPNGIKIVFLKKNFAG